jgi:DNA helicase II / ATP-dependent DNA helicase PcrA
MKTFTITRQAHGVDALNLHEALNPQQLAAVTCGSGPKLVIAGAGSGKTRTITYRVAYLLAQGVQPTRIMLATFTNKASREMLHRVERLTGQPTSTLWGGTFHSLANRMLRQHADRIDFASNYSILDSEDQRDLIKVCMTELKIKLEEERFPHASVIRGLLSRTFNNHVTLPNLLDDRYPHFRRWTSEIERIGDLYQEKKCAANAMDYDDLLRFWHQLLTEHDDLLHHYGELFEHILVDEYQDTNAIQSEIVELLASRNGENIMVVGDDCQSIYQFRGANFANILEFPDRNPHVERFHLEINYRSTPQILDLANASIRNNVEQFEKTLQPARGVGDLPTLVATNDPYQEAIFVAEHIVQQRDEGVPLDEMAVLYRAHAHSTLLQAELIRRNIPYDIRSGMRFFEQAHVKDVVAYLKILWNPMDEAAWRRLLLMLPRVGHVTAGKLWSYIAAADDPLARAWEDQTALTVPSGARPGWRAFIADVKYLHGKRTSVPPAELVREVMTTSYADRLKNRYENALSRIEEIESLALFAEPYASLDTFLSELVLLGELYSKESKQAPGDMEERVILTTVHQAKGLEWNIVFLMRLCEGGFPAQHAIQEPRDEEEERRVFYVAVTRAKDQLLLTYPLVEMHGRTSGFLQPSRFIQELDTGLYEAARIEERWI